MSDDRDDGPLDLPDWLRPFLVVAALVAVMWVVEVVDTIPGVDLDRFAIRPRTLSGLFGIVTAPFLHAGFGHLIANTIPFLVLGSIIALGGTMRYLQVTGIIALVAGVGTWLSGGGDTIHLGASSLVFGYLTYLLGRAVFERKLVYLLGGAVVLFLYGGVLWGLLPRPGISWQGHVFGALGGLVAAYALHASRDEPDALPA